MKHHVYSIMLAQFIFEMCATVATINEQSTKTLYFGIQGRSRQARLQGAAPWHVPSAACPRRPRASERPRAIRPWSPQRTYGWIDQS